MFSPCIHNQLYSFFVSTGVPDMQDVGEARGAKSQISTKDRQWWQRRGQEQWEPSQEEIKPGSGLVISGSVLRQRDRRKQAPI
jgi:hypothetical protein